MFIKGFNKIEIEYTMIEIIIAYFIIYILLFITAKPIAYLFYKKLVLKL